MVNILLKVRVETCLFLELYLNNDTPDGDNDSNDINDDNNDDNDINDKNNDDDKNYDNANDDSGDQTICHAMRFNRA